MTEVSEQYLVLLEPPLTFQLSEVHLPMINAVAEATAWAVEHDRAPPLEFCHRCGIKPCVAGAAGYHEQRLSLANLQHTQTKLRRFKLKQMGTCVLSVGG